MKSADIVLELLKATPERKQTKKLQAAAARKTRRAARRARPKATPKEVGSATCTERTSGAKYQVGTSGFMVSKSLWTSLPCLNCIEINSTFYHLPKAKTIDTWKLLPERVGLVIKASKYITHQKRLHDVKEAWETLWALISPLGKKLRCVLFQLPPSFHLNETNLARVTAMRAYLPRDLNVAFEFRDRSWFVEEVYDAMKKAGFCMAGTFIKKRESNNKWLGTMPAGLLMPPRTANISYIRVHGGRGYRGALSGAQLEQIRTALSEQATRQAFVMFNNTFFDKRGEYCDVAGKEVKYAAVCNAAQFASSLGADPGSGTTRRRLSVKTGGARGQGVHARLNVRDYNTTRVARLTRRTSPGNRSKRPFRKRKSSTPSKVDVAMTDFRTAAPEAPSSKRGTMPSRGPAPTPIR